MVALKDKDPADRTPAEQRWLDQIGNATAHMVKGVSKTDMHTTCGLRIAQGGKHVGTVWHTRVTCRKCLRIIGPGSPGEILAEEVWLSDDEIEW